MDQQDAAAFLKAKRGDRNPKCANCKHWDFVVEAETVAPCDQHGRTPMTDLAVCSGWEGRDAVG